MWIAASLVGVCAILPPRWLGWTGEVGAILWIPLHPLAHAGTAAREWLRPAAREVPPADVLTLLEERQELLGLVARLRIELERAQEEIAALQAEPAPRAGDPRPIAATVLGVGSDGGVIRLNRGTRHGVSAGDPVVEGGDRLVGVVAAPVGASWCEVFPASTRGGGSIRARIVDRDGALRSLVLLEPRGGSWQGEIDESVDLTEVAVRLDDPTWTSTAQGLLIGEVASSRAAPARPLRVEIVVRPAAIAGSADTLVIRRLDPTSPAEADRSELDRSERNAP